VSTMLSPLSHTPESQITPPLPQSNVPMIPVRTTLVIPVEEETEETTIAAETTIAVIRTMTAATGTTTGATGITTETAGTATEIGITTDNMMTGDDG
jgi:hypothetical protein